MKLALMLVPQWDTEWPISSLALLSAQLKRFGHEVSLCDLNKEFSLMSAESPPFAGDRNGEFRKLPSFDPNLWDYDSVRENIFPAYRRHLEAVADRLLSEGVRLFGFSIYFSNWGLSLCLAELIKKKDPAAVVVFGGPSCLQYKRCLDLLKHECVDAVVYGEADLALPALVNGLERSGALRAAPGILLRTDPASWREDQETLSNLDELPHADYGAYSYLDRYEGKTLHTCRGCVRRCSFCSDWREMSYRQMSGEKIFAEVRHQLREHPRITAFHFADSLVNGDMKALIDFCDRVIEEGVVIEWRGYAIARREMTPEALAKMRRAGCVALFYGVESGSAKVLRDMHKTVSPELNGRVLADTRESGIYTGVPIIVGYPSETEEDFKNTLDFVRGYSGGIGLMGPSLFSIKEMVGDLERHGVAPTAHMHYWKSRDGQNTYPVRLKRLKRLFEVAAENSVTVAFEGRVSIADMEEHFAAEMARYSRWAEAQP